MTLLQIEERLTSLERTVLRLAKSKPSIDRDWYRTQAGRFANDPIFEQIVKLGREYRKAQRPSRRSRRA
jgi:hypothetical protein